MLVASMRDSADSYASGFLLLVVLAAIGAAAVALLPRTGQAAQNLNPTIVRAGRNH
jgi:hypothetical protein